MKLDLSKIDMKAVRKNVATRISAGAKPARANVEKFIDETGNDPIATTAYVISTIHGAVAYSAINSKYVTKYHKKK